MFVLRA